MNAGEGRTGIDWCGVPYGDEGGRRMLCGGVADRWQTNLQVTGRQ